MKDRLGVLDGLRGIAILQVLWYHVSIVGKLPAPFPWLQFVPATGAYGVQLFFFLSGFVIVYPFARAQFANEREPTWTHFAWRRFIKIVPSYALSIAAAYAIGFAAFERTQSTAVWQELVTHALFIHTWWPATASSINGPLWTLAIEVQFYALFPLLWWCFRRRPLVTGIAMIALTWSLRVVSRFAGLGVLTINLPGFSDFFGYGMLCAWAFVHFGHRIRSGRFAKLAPAAGLAGAALAVVILWRVFNDKGSIIVLGIPVLQTAGVLGFSFALLAFGALCTRGPWALLLSNPLLRFFALISYNLYLFNWMIINELRTRDLVEHMGRESGQIHFTAVALFTSVLVATAMTYLIERPLMRLHPTKLLGSGSIRVSEGT